MHLALSNPPVLQRTRDPWNCTQITQGSIGYPAPIRQSRSTDPAHESGYRPRLRLPPSISIPSNHRASSGSTDPNMPRRKASIGWKPRKKVVKQTHLAVNPGKVPEETTTNPTLNPASPQPSTSTGRGIDRNRTPSRGRPTHWFTEFQAAQSDASSSDESSETLQIPKRPKQTKERPALPHTGRTTRSSLKASTRTSKKTVKAQHQVARRANPPVPHRRQRPIDFVEAQHRLPLSNVGRLDPTLEGTKVCPHCQALLFVGESSALCCHHGTTVLPPIRTPLDLKALFTQPRFLANIRRWNNAFAMASIGMDKKGGGPTRRRKSLCGDQAAMCRRQLVGEANLDEAVLATLTHIVEAVNPYVKDIKTALEVMQEQVALPSPSDRRLLPPDAHARTYNVPEATEVAGIILGDQHLPRSREGAVRLPDIVLHYRPNPSRRLDKINTTHRSYDPLMYVLLFPHGEDGWTRNLSRRNTGERRSKLTEADFYAYRIQVRAGDDFNIITRSRRLFQMYLIDQWAKI
eukprot:TCALIF_13711-PA protein Name:"Protein of unknown function" AED:0.29 eAED:0.32 QI:0/0/0/0.5/1/1/6/0/518